MKIKTKTKKFKIFFIGVTIYIICLLGASSYFIFFFPITAYEPRCWFEVVYDPTYHTTVFSKYMTDRAEKISCDKIESQNSESRGRMPDLGKPVIYLYPLQKEDATVKLNFDGKILSDYPDINTATESWDVTAYPDGHLINKADNQEYNYLFWEGIPTSQINWDLSKGFIVSGVDTKQFLQQALSKFGLTPKEYNEFIVYWYPKMQNNKYNLIHFGNNEYTQAVPLTISPQPDSILRVFMVYKPLNEKINITQQIIPTFVRKGFSVIEWGGTELN